MFKGSVVAMNSTEQMMFNSMFNTVSRSVEFNSNGLKIMINTPKCCKKVIINENILENEIRSSDVNLKCSDKELDGKKKNCESNSSIVQGTCDKNTAEKGNKNFAVSVNEMKSKMENILRRNGNDNVITEKNSNNVEFIIDKISTDNTVVNSTTDSKPTGKSCESNEGIEVVSVQQITTPSDCNSVSIDSEVLEVQKMENVKSCNNSKDTTEKSTNTVPKIASKHSNVPKNILIGKDTKVIVRTFNINTKRHIPNSGQKTGSVLFPSKFQDSKNGSVNFDTKNVVSSQVDVKRVCNPETRNLTLQNQQQPVKLNCNLKNNEYIIIKDLPWRTFKLKDSSVCPYCSRCVAKSDAQSQTDLSGTFDGSNIVIGRVDPESSHFGNGAVKYIKKDLKNLGKLVYVNRSKLLNGHNNNLNNYRKILPHPPFRAVYHADFVNETRKGKQDSSNMSDLHSSGPIIEIVDNNLVNSNSSQLLNGSANGNTEVVTSQLQTRVRNTHIYSLSDVSQADSGKNVKQGDSLDQCVCISEEGGEDVIEGDKNCTSPTDSCGSSTTANSPHGTELQELGVPSAGCESNNRNVIFQSHRNVEEFADKGSENNCLSETKKTYVSQDKLLNSVMWAPSRNVLQKKLNHEKFRRIKLLKTMYEDWMNCQQEDEDGNLLLHKAVLSNNIAAVTRHTVILKACEKGSSCNPINHQNAKGDTALMIAAGIPDIKEDIVAILVHRFHIDQTVRNKISGNTALHIASSSGNINCVRLLLAAPGAKDVVNLFNDEGFAPLHLAARHGYGNIICELVDNEAEINLKDKRGGYTPLYHAWNGGHIDACNTLMGLGAEGGDAFFPDQLSAPGAESRASESTLLISGRKRKQKVHTDKSSSSDRSSDGECTYKKGKYS